MRSQFAVFLLLVTIFVAACTGTAVSESTLAPEVNTDAQRDYWPTDDWRTSTPEAQGIDSDRLADMLEHISDSDAEIDSVTVVRNGHVVLDATYYPFPGGTGHIIHSCTKSILSSLIGIAIDEGLVEGLDQPVVGILSESAPASPDPLKSSMTVEDLLTMTTGLQCRDSYRYDWEGLFEMRASDDWADHVLALPMSEEPGTRFEYCNGSSYLLSAILSDVTGQSALEYAEDVLFGPLGISDVSWPSNSEGINIGWGEMVLQPSDMAKIGYLHLRNGVWDGVQVLPEGWVEASTAAHISARSLASYYGYQWWVGDTTYSALGFGGQYIIVAPDIDVVAVFTSGLADSEFDLPRTLFNRFVVGAITGDDTLSPNPEGEARLQTLAAAVATPPEPQAPPESPPLAAEINGARFTFDDNAGAFAWFQLNFGSDEARFRFEDTDGPIDVPVGLDGVPRIAEAWGNPWAFTGEWVDNESFRIEWQRIGRAARGTFEFSFGTDQVDMVFRIATSGRTYDAVAHADVG